MRSRPSRRLTAVGREVRRWAEAARRWEWRELREERAEGGKYLVGEEGERRSERSSEAIPSEASEAIAGAPRICQRVGRRKDSSAPKLSTDAVDGASSHRRAPRPNSA